MMHFGMGPTPGIKLVEKREAYFPIHRQDSGILRVADVHWAVGSHNRRSESLYGMIRLLVKGEVEGWNGDKFQAINPGSLILHPSNAPYHLRVTGTEPANLWLVATYGDAWNRRWRSELGPHPLIRPCVDVAEMTHLFEATLCRGTASDEKAAVDGDTYLGQIMNLCKRSLANSRTRRSIKGIEDAKRLLRDRLHLPIRIGALAAELGVDRTTLNRRFQQALGQSPQGFLQLLRLQEAARLLLESTMSVMEVGESVGFSCPFAFSKAFKRHFGCPPSAYRNNG